jgi:hypothetical protein
VYALLYICLLTGYLLLILVLHFLRFLFLIGVYGSCCKLTFCINYYLSMLCSLLFCVLFGFSYLAVLTNPGQTYILLDDGRTTETCRNIIK